MADELTQFLTQEYHHLTDKSSTGKEQPWEDRKRKSEIISQSFYRLGDKKKSQRMNDCGTFLEFKKSISTGDMKLHTANFCKIRLCPMCMWRRSKKIFAQMSQIMDYAQKNNPNADYLFLTLTIRNVEAAELSSAIDLLVGGYNSLFKQKAVKNAVLGAYRALEITHNNNIRSKAYDTYHPHLHVILMVDKSYFKKRSGAFITQEQWQALWKQCIKADYEPIVHIEKIQEKVGKDGRAYTVAKGVAEAAKYPIKDDSIFIKGKTADKAVDDKVIETFDRAMAGRRLISYRGEFAKIKKALNLDDPVDGDLVHTGDEEELRADLDYIIVRFKWSVGFKTYLEVDDNFEFKKR